MTDVAIYQLMLQAVSTLSVASGLVYGALQLRNWRIAQHVGNFTKLVELQLQLRKMRVDDPQPTHRDPHGDPAGSQEDVREYFYELMQLSLFEIAWFSHRHGQLPDDYFRSWVTSMSAMAARPSFQAMWRSTSTKIMHDRFRAYVETLVAEVTPEERAGPAGPDSRSIEESVARANVAGEPDDARCRTWTIGPAPTGPIERWQDGHRVRR